MSSYQRAAILVPVSSMLLPAVGLATAPMLARSLGVVGRGEAAAGAAPFLVAMTMAALGVPQAITFFVAKRPYLTRRALWLGAYLSLPLGCLTVVVLYELRNYLSGDNGQLATFIVLGSLFVLPALAVGLIRGVAIGHQMWSAVAGEKAITATLRLGAILILSVTHNLDVLWAVLITCASPVFGGLAYLRVIVYRPAVSNEAASEDFRLGANQLLKYGSTVWLGSVATMLLARLNEIFVVPLSNAEQLGLLVIAVTVSDVPYIVVQALKDVVFGSNSADFDTIRLAATCRVTTLVSFIGCAIVAGSLPYWIVFVFGPGFEGSKLPAFLLLASSCAAVPGLVAGAGLESYGRPGRRATALATALLVDFVLVITLIPSLGATGAAIAVLASTFVSSTITVVSMASAVHVPTMTFLLPVRSDLLLLRTMIRKASNSMRP